MSIAANLNDALKDLKWFVLNLQIGKACKINIFTGFYFNFKQKKDVWYLATHLFWLVKIFAVANSSVLFAPSKSSEADS